MKTDGLTENDVIEAIINAPRIDKVIRSHRPSKSGRTEKLYVIKGLTFGNIIIYTKGKIVKDAESETFYILISSKRAV